jgi:hypothetical protein
MNIQYNKRSKFKKMKKSMSRDASIPKHTNHTLSNSQPELNGMLMRTTSSSRNIS